jgi:hypothetical protein
VKRGKVYDIEIMPGGLEMRAWTAGWFGPWRSTEPEGQHLLERDIARHRFTQRVATAMAVATMVTGGIWLAALAALGIWVVVRLVSTW